MEDEKRTYVINIEMISNRKTLNTIIQIENIILQPA